MSILGGGIFSGMMVTLRNFVGSYFDSNRLTTNDYSWKPKDQLPQSAGEYPKEEGEQLSDTTTVTNYSRNFPMLLHNLLCGKQSIDIQKEMNINMVDVVRWMPCGKSWIVRDWNTFTKMSSRYFVPLQGKESFLREIQAWGFEEKWTRDGSVSFHHEVSYILSLAFQILAMNEVQ